MFNRRKMKKLFSDNISYFELFCSGIRGDLNGNSVGKSRLLTDLLLDQKEMQRRMQSQTKSPQDRLSEFREKYSKIDLRSCPLCGGQALLKIVLTEYTQREGLPGGFSIDATIECCNCTCGLKPITIYTNIFTLNGVNSWEEKNSVDSIIKVYSAKWNTRFDDMEKLRIACRHRSSAEPFFVDFQRGEDGKEPGECLERPNKLQETVELIASKHLDGEDMKDLQGNENE